MNVTLTKRAVGGSDGGPSTASDPVNRFEVEPSTDKQVFLIGFNVGRPHQKEYWEITGRKGQYKSSDEALAALQDEMNEDSMVWV